MLHLGRAHLDALWGHARREAPLEACGVLGGREEGPDARVEVAHPCRNASPSPETAFLLHPDDQLRAFLDIEDARGLDVVGFYHSHPDGPPGPSAVDAASATYPGARYVVLWMAPVRGVGAWRWAPRRGFVGEPLRSDGSGGAEPDQGNG